VPDPDPPPGPPPTSNAALLRAVRTDRWALLGAVAIGGLGLLAAGADLWTAIEGQDPYTYDTGALDPATGGPAGALGGMSAAHWFGVEPLTGRDLFAIVAYGARTSFLIGLAATAIAVLLGVLIGAGAGYLGGWVDRVVSSTSDVIFGFPYLVFLIALGAVLPPSAPRPLVLIVVIGFFGWPRVARIVRAQTLTLKQRRFVTAARTMGAPIIVVATLSVPERIGLEAALSFLNVGIPPPTPSWGRSISDAVDWVESDPAFLLFPGLALFVATLAFNLLGDGLRDAFDPRSTH
jgi:peptide/nickel transport system permease protein